MPLLTYMYMYAKLPKVHKPGIPMQPIVSFCGSPTYQLSKYLTNVLKPLTDESGDKVLCTENFIDAIKTIQIPDDHKLVSCDLKSLFTSIPLQMVLDCSENAVKNSAVKLPLPNTNELQEMVMSTITLLNTIYRRNVKSTGTLRHVLCFLQTTINDSL